MVTFEQFTSTERPERLPRNPPSIVRCFVIGAKDDCPGSNCVQELRPGEFHAYRSIFTRDLEVDWIEESNVTISINQRTQV